MIKLPSFSISALMALAAVIATLSLAPKSYALPQSIAVPFFSAKYEAVIQGFPLEAKREYKPISDTISELNFSATSLLASLTESSQFSWDEEQIKPIRFTHERKIFGQSKRKTLSFDWNKQQIISTHKGKTRHINNDLAALDRLSFQLQLQHDLSANIEDKVYRIADKNKIKEYAFEIIGEEVITTPLGKLNTTKVKVLRDNNKRVTYIWLARDWHNLLARLEQYEKDDKKFAIEVTKAVIDGKKVAGL